MKIVDAKINGIRNPVGYDLPYLICTYTLEGEYKPHTGNTRIEISLYPDFSELLYKIEGLGLHPGGVELQFVPEARRIYYYRIIMEGEEGKPVLSPVFTFETGKMGEVWEGEWIGPQKEDAFHPLLEKTFSVTKEVSRARLYICGLGLFEAFLNREKIGEEFLTPYLNHYEKGFQSFTFPLTGIKEGENRLEVLLGKGWYMGTFGLEGKDRIYGSRMAMIAEIHLEYGDGSREVIKTDGSWRYKGSCIAESGIYYGEDLDCLLWEGRDNPLKAVQVLEEGKEGLLQKDRLIDRRSLPVLIKETIPVKEVIVTPAGETVLDFGQNFAGFVSFLAEGKKGAKITLDFGEILQEGNFYRDNYREARSRFVYTADGKKEWIRPHFTFFGFRYVRVAGWEKTPDPADFCGCVLYSDMERTGFIKTNHEKLNRLYENTLWGLKSNFLDIPTDCPQRNERLGWTGDAQVFAPTASYHMDTSAFFRKFLRDLRDEQSFLSGGIPNYFPNIGHKEDVTNVWGDIAVFLPLVLYRHYGSKRDLSASYPLMRDWVEFLDKKDSERGLRSYMPNLSFQFGDWLGLDGISENSFKGGTEDAYIGAVYYYASVKGLSYAAGELSYKKDQRRYEALSEKIKEAILSEYFTPKGRLSEDTQAAYIIALKFGLWRDKEKLIAAFKERLRKDGYRIRCGFVGAPLLCTVLAEIGETELAYDFLLKEGFPGWFYAVDLGATTIWERWNSVLEDGSMSPTGMNSLNHYAYGSVMEFAYAYMAGIRPLDPGFKRALFAPEFDGRLHHVKASYDSVSGRYGIEYEIKADGTVELSLSVPPAGNALLLLPREEGGWKEEKAKREKQEGRWLPAGEHRVLCRPKRDYTRPYGEKTPLARALEDERLLGLIQKHTPILAAFVNNPEFCCRSLGDFRRLGFLPIDREKLENLIREASELQYDYFVKDEKREEKKE